MESIMSRSRLLALLLMALGLWYAGVRAWAGGTAGRASHTD
jgi:hypothetical protein